MLVAFADAWRILVSIIAPIAFGNALEYLPVTFGLAMVGHQPGLSEEELALQVDAMMLARAYFNLVAMAPGFGVITPLRTLCPQAVGAGREDALPMYANLCAWPIECHLVASANSCAQVPTACCADHPSDQRARNGLIVDVRESLVVCGSGAESREACGALLHSVNATILWMCHDECRAGVILRPSTGTILAMNPPSRGAHSSDEKLAVAPIS